MGISGKTTEADIEIGLSQSTSERLLRELSETQDIGIVRDVLRDLIRELTIEESSYYCR